MTTTAHSGLISKYSVTTSRQINQYLGGKEVGRTVSQEYINSLVEVA